MLAVNGLTVEFASPDGVIRAVDGVTFDVKPGEAVGIVGESGSGKSVTAQAILRLLPMPPARIVSGSISFAGHDLLTARESTLRQIRGNQISMIFQEPIAALDPLLKIGFQIAESLRAHDLGLSRRAARDQAVELLRAVQIPNPERRADQYAHQFSGGMAQRVGIAIGIANKPRLVIADEPTTALDVTVQAQIMETLQLVRKTTDAAMILITHDAGLIAEFADRVLVMYAGRIVESASVHAILEDPSHPYTAALIASLPNSAMAKAQLASIPGQPPNPAYPPSGCAFSPRCHVSAGRAICREELPVLATVRDGQRSACHFPSETVFPRSAKPTSAKGTETHDSSTRSPAAGLGVASSTHVLEVRGLRVYYPVRSELLKRVVGHVHAVDGVDLHIGHGETLALVGESGCGKTTTVRTIIGLSQATGGSILLNGHDISKPSKRQLRLSRRQMQLVFQNPYGSLNPRSKVEAIIAEPLVEYGVDSKEGVRRRVYEVMEKMGLDPSHAKRYPHEFSGGQRQRIGIARALVLEPQLLLLDEPVSALDASVQAQILNLLLNLQKELGLSYLIIAHDLAVIKHVADRVSVMYLGKVMETGQTDALFKSAAHPYTKALLSAAPIPDTTQRHRGDRIILEGDLPSPIDPPSGCRFRTRCWKADDLCAEQVPDLVPRNGTLHPCACHYATVDTERVPRS